MAVLDTILAWLVTPVGQGLFALLLLSVAGRGLYHTLQRRQGFSQFAAHHGLRVVGTIAPDGRPPYERIEHLKWSVLIHNTLEGEWEGLQVAVFDMKPSKHVTQTAAIVHAPDILGDGPTGSGPGGRFAEVTAVGELLYVRAHTALTASALAGFLSDAVALARARSARPTEAR
jgi:hypothetical protein